MPRLIASRPRVVAAVLTALFVLDAARSVVARRGYAAPAEVWQPDPKDYVDLAWPPGAALASGTALGPKVFAERCAVCHGPEGLGNGPAASSLIPRPRDLTLGDFKYKSTVADTAPTDSDLTRIVTDGLAASAMPAFGDILSPEEIEAVVGYVKDLSDVFRDAPPRVLDIPRRRPADARSIQRGKVVWAALQCAKCHGDDGRKWQVFMDAKGRPVRNRDLTAPWTFRGGSEPEQIGLRIANGVGPMPAYADAASGAELSDLVNYLVSTFRRAPWEPGGKLDGPGYAADKVARGDYLAHAVVCQLCHTQINPTGIYRADDRFLAGGMRVGMYPHGFYITRNLSGDLETGIGKWTDEQFAHAIRNGRAPDRVLNPVGMPWLFFHAFDTSDAEAIGAYLKTTPPAYQPVPPPLRYGLVETVAVKLTRPLPTAFPEALTFADGNFAGLSQTPAKLQRWLVLAQWLVLALGVILFVLATPPERRLPRGVKGWVKAVLVLVLVGFASLFLRILYDLPALAMIPAEQVTAPILAQAPKPDPAQLALPEHHALAERGRYLYLTASCALCHGIDGRGSMKISWRPMGSFWVRNITSDRETGLGQWTDAEITRAIRSGIRKGGRQLHWQAMPWDLWSNMDEEDLRALVAYLRTLPPVMLAVPDPQPPSPADCEVYTFFTQPDRDPKSGCFTTE